ncbi:MAG: CoA transferase, partial [bacterium]
MSVTIPAGRKPDFSRGPLAGYRVVDASSVVAGPMAAMVLADQGADVIKLESPGVGDLGRQAINEREGMAALYLNCNRGKRSIVVDIKQPEGLEVARDLIRSADVFLANWRPGVADRLGLGEAELRVLNPELINVQVTGFGRTGPYSDHRVYDPVLQALAGYVALQE